MTNVTGEDGKILYGTESYVELIGEMNLPVLRAVRRGDEVRFFVGVGQEECTDVERIGAIFVRWAEFMLEPRRRKIEVGGSHG